MRYSGPAGMTEQDDMENWLYATRASAGAVARQHAFNYQQSLGATALNPTVHGIQIRGEVATQCSEHMARGFYRRWSGYLSGASWDELLGGNDPRFRSVDAAE